MAVDHSQVTPAGLRFAPDEFNCLRINIASSSQISSCARRIIGHLDETEQMVSTPLTPLVMLKAKSGVTNKLISIVEIANRELKTKKIKVYQYNMLKGETVEIRQSEVDKADPVTEEERLDEGAFEPLREELQLKKLAFLHIYLCRKPILKLKRDYGEQNNMPAE